MEIDHRLVSASHLARIGILPRGTAYRMAKAGRLPTYHVGQKGAGVRFKVEEVLATMRRSAANVK